MTRTRGETAELQRLDQIPPQMTEEETDRFWETHSLGEALLEQLEPFPDDFPLPPRTEMQGRRGPEQESDAFTLPIGKIVLGLAAAGALAICGYLVYRWARSSGVVGLFQPTSVSYLKASPLVGSAGNLAGSMPSALRTPWNPRARRPLN